MENAIADLLNRFGYGSIWTLIGVLIVKYAIKPSFDTYLEFKKEKNKQILQSKIDQESKIQSSVLEFEKYKKDIVLPVLQDMANILEKKHSSLQEYCSFLFSDYKHSKKPSNLVNGMELFAEIEEINRKSKELFEAFIIQKRKVSIYLPKELRTLLLQFHILMEKDLFSINDLKSFYDMEFREKSLLTTGNNIIKIYLKYLDCYYAIVEKYIEITYKEKDYLLIFKEHDLNENAEFLYSTKDEYECALNILGVVRRNEDMQNEIIKKAMKTAN